MTVGKSYFNVKTVELPVAGSTCSNERVNSDFLEASDTFDVSVRLYFVLLPFITRVT